MPDPLPVVNVAFVQAHPEVRLADVRWTPAPPPARERYLQGHLPGAVFVDLDRDLAQPGGPGRHPLPSEEAFAGTLARLGIGEETHVVAYDDGNGAIAARFWFMLRVHGHARVSVLEGGLAAWRAAGLPLTQAEPAPAPAPLRALRLDRARLVDREGVRARGAAVLLDARAGERYRGEVEPIDRRAGHIPGALNAPFTQNLLPDGRWKPAGELRALYERLGPDVIASCGSGVTACHLLLARELAGLAPGRLYVGSWSDWSSDPSRPIATGAEPGALRRRRPQSMAPAINGARNQWRPQSTAASHKGRQWRGLRRLTGACEREFSSKQQPIVRLRHQRRTRRQGGGAVGVHEVRPDRPALPPRVLGEVVNRVADREAHLARRAQPARVVAVGEHRPAPAKDAVQPPRHAHLEPLHRPPERDLVGRLDDEVEVIALHREMNEPEAEADAPQLERARNRPEAAVRPQVPDLAPHPAGDVQRCFVKRRPRAMRHLRARRPALAARPAARASPGLEVEADLHGHSSTMNGGSDNRARGGHPARPAVQAWDVRPFKQRLAGAACGARAGSGAPSPGDFDRADLGRRSARCLARKS